MRSTTLSAQPPPPTQPTPVDYVIGRFDFSVRSPKRHPGDFIRSKLLLTRQVLQETIQAAVRRFHGASDVTYYVVHVEHDVRRRLWRVFVDTPSGFELVEAKNAAIDCGSPLGRDSTTHEHWKLLWDGAQ